MSAPSTPAFAVNFSLTARAKKKRRSVYYAAVWGVEDSNLRRLSQQIYSLPHLTALETPRFKLVYKKIDVFARGFCQFVLIIPSAAHAVMTASRFDMAEFMEIRDAKISGMSAPAML